MHYPADDKKCWHQGLPGHEGCPGRPQPAPAAANPLDVGYRRLFLHRERGREPRAFEAGEEWPFLTGWLWVGLHAVLLSGSYSRSCVR